ncbi:shikimate dehydrogenase [Priestia taiwanensis]|uniref:Shikimate dehydrogenase (NADP(+)) n=1 Tax=Priestia taiwanensis TaxID=1347902 RepID=A0A917AUV7_9BACI|nr:shikimate dehydrogenase [Priestia taiwanensis]MBM7363706.1 shikimate dehydrogenase [Priestia taiwanensis]GGE74786.1 shikimate dehydrogenase (NADP(+)) [Priestia taiwanensis]
MKKIYGVIGYPIGHSMSPVMHNNAFSHHEIDGYYTAFQVHPRDLEDAIKGMKALQIGGFNVTTPHKVHVMDYLDEVDSIAKSIGAVNTIVHLDGKLIGYNTDGIGYVRALQEISGDLKKKRILIVGAGGACRAIFFTLASLGVKHIDIANRTVQRAADLITDCAEQQLSHALTIVEAEQQIDKYDIIINTTTVGMHPYTDDIPISLDGLRRDSIVSDIIYNPLETKLLKVAHDKGAVIQNGVGMFVYQGALAFEKWTGVMPNIERMKKIVEEQLGGKNTC